MYSNENGSYISKADFQKSIPSIEFPNTIDSEAMAVLFDRVDTILELMRIIDIIAHFKIGVSFQSDKVTYEEFANWMKQYKDATSLSRWLFSECNSVSLNNELDMPTFYQTLAGVTHCK